MRHVWIIVPGLLVATASALGQGLQPGAHLGRPAVQTDPTAVSRLIDDLRNPDEAVRLRAAKELGKLGAAAATAIPALESALKDTDEDVRVVAGNSLNTIRATQSGNRIQRLIQDLQNPDESVRLRAAKEISKIGPSAYDAQPFLAKLLRDPDADVRQMATIALARVTEAIFPPPSSRPDLFILSVGIDRYPPPINQLAGCVNDATGMAKMFQRQANKTFGRVEAQILTDADGTYARIDAAMTGLRAKGKTGDWYVMVLSGHGGQKRNRWGFVTHDGKEVTDAALLDLADRLAGEGKKLVMIVDACFSGQLRYAAHPILNKHTDPKKGGIILMVSSAPAQVSAALQRYSAFAQAVEEGLSGLADYDGDQTITLKELRRYTYNRVYELCLNRRPMPGLIVQPQDSAIDASLSIAETTPLAHGQKAAPPLRKLGPFTAMPQLVGVWVSGTYRLKLDSNGTYRATVTQANRTVQSGDGVFKANAESVILQHLQGEDRLEIASVTGSEFRLRFQGRDITLRKETAAAPTVASIAGTTWSGTESLAGPGKVTFQFKQGGEVLMVDAKTSMKGTWTQTADKVRITFASCVYEATIQGQSMAGTARSITDNRVWSFAVSVPGAATPDGPVASVAGTIWSGSESLSSFGALTFEFHDGGKVVMIDAQSTVNGGWTQEGNQLTITFQNCVYIGRIHGTVLSGNARFTQGEPRPWTFSLTRTTSPRLGANRREHQS